jgi:hypothetical protein
MSTSTTRKESLQTAGFSGREFYTSLFLFNVGVELAQLLIILTGYYLVARPFAGKIWYRPQLVRPFSAAIACVAMYWTLMRLMA